MRPRIQLLRKLCRRRARCRKIDVTSSLRVHLSPSPSTLPKQCRKSSSLVSWLEVLLSKGRIDDPRSCPIYEDSTCPRGNRNVGDEVPPRLQVAKLARPRQLSTDMQYWTFSFEAGVRPYSEDVADRNLIKETLRRLFDYRLASKLDSPRAIPRRSSSLNGGSALNKSFPRPPITPQGYTDFKQQREYQAQVLATARPVNELRLQPSRRPRPHSTGSLILTYDDRPCVLNRKPNIFNLRNAREVSHIRSRLLPADRSKMSFDLQQRSSIRRTELSKPLPLPPAIKLTAHIDRGDCVHGKCGQDPAADVNNVTIQPLSASIAAKEKTSQTVIHKRWASAVTHETITRNMHEIREEHITRYTHQPHIYQYIRPVVDFEVVPARHFFPFEGGFIEISKDDIPAEALPDEESLKKEAISRALRKLGTSAGEERRESGEFEKVNDQWHLGQLQPDFQRTESTYAYPQFTLAAIRGSSRGHTLDSPQVIEIEV